MTKKHVDELRQTGATSFPFLSEESCNRIISETTSSYTLKLAKTHKGPRSIHQRFFEVDVDPFRSPSIRHVADTVRSHVIEAIKTYAGEEGIEDFTFKQFRVHKYPVGGGIGLHQDGGIFRNVVVVVLLKGESCFYVADNRNGENKRLIPATPGSCIVIAAPGLFGEKKQTLHCVEGVTSERWSFTLRDGILNEQE